VTVGQDTGEYAFDILSADERRELATWLLED
jgi:hypothetical protein